MRIAIIDKIDEQLHVVTNIIEIADIATLEEFKQNISCEEAFDVDYNVDIGNTYDPETGILYNADKVRVFPPISVDEQITELKDALIDAGMVSLIDYDKMNNEDKYKAKIKEIKILCRKSIEKGYDVEISEGEVLHFSMSEYRQKDMEDNYNKILQGAEFVYFRDDSRLMVEKYSAEKFLKVYESLTNQIFADKVYSDGLEMLATEVFKNGFSIDDISWGYTLPSYIQSTVDELISGNELLKKGLLNND